MHSDARIPKKHVIAALPDYVAGTLSTVERGRVQSHLARCAMCREELQAWERIAGATQLAASTAFAPAPTLMATVWATIDAPSPAVAPVTLMHTASRWHRWQVFWWQAQLLNPIVWLASLVAVIAVTYVASQQALASRADLVLSAGLPLISAVGIAFLYGHEIDPLLELAVATPTSPRWIFFSRWTLLFGYNMALSLFATMVLASLQGQSLWAIMSLWLGPMALLATLSALVTLVVSPALAALGAFLLWTTRFVQIGAGVTFVLAAPPRWQTNPAILLLAVALFVLALAVVGRQERFA